jgi:hypothetical protein
MVMACVSITQPRIFLQGAQAASPLRSLAVEMGSVRCGESRAESGRKTESIVCKRWRLVAVSRRWEP